MNKPNANPSAASKVTARMIAAGVDVLCSYDEEGDRSEIVRRVFLEMMKAQGRSQSEDATRQILAPLSDERA
jgi:hypothetical protein